MAKKETDKKKALKAKNRKTFEMLTGMHEILDEDERIRADTNKKRAKKREQSGDKEDSPIWSEKVSSVRNRLNNKRRTSKERWNRFAGTGDEGGRGL